MSRIIKQSLWLAFKLAYLALILFVIAGILGCSPNQTTSSPTQSFTEPAIPTNYHTYTDETSSFSISYPPEWEVAQALLEQLNQTVKDTLKNLSSDLPVEKASFIFLAGLPNQGGYSPNVGIVIEPLPTGVKNQDQLIEAAIEGIKLGIPDFAEISRTKTKIDGIDGSIFEYTGTFPDAPKTHYLYMCLYRGQTAWSVTCSSTPEDFDGWKGDFQSIVRSLRILK